MPDLNSLLMFAKVVEANSFAEASRRMNIPIATVSRRVAELEEELGFRLLERSTRSLRLTDVGAEIIAYAQETVAISHAVDSIASNQHSEVSGTLKLSAPPNLAETIVSPLVNTFQGMFPGVSVHLLITERFVDHIAEDVDISFRIGSMRDSSLVGRKLLTYRQQLVATPDYIEQYGPLTSPQELSSRRVIAFSRWSTDCTWAFNHIDGETRQTVTFQPSLSFNDFSGIAECLLAGEGIGHLPPVVRPDLIRNGLLVEVMPEWHFPVYDLVMLHLGNRHIARPVKLFKEMAGDMVPRLFPQLPA